MRVRLLALIAAALGVAFGFALDREPNQRSVLPREAPMHGSTSGKAKPQLSALARRGATGRKQDWTRAEVRSVSPSSTNPARTGTTPAATSPGSAQHRTDAIATPTRGGAHSWPYFDRIATEPGYVTTGITGVDPVGPRSLVLWELGQDPRAIATTDSDDRGRFDFGQQIVPASGIRLAVAPAGTTPLADDSPPAPSTLLLHLGGAIGE